MKRFQSAMSNEARGLENMEERNKFNLQFVFFLV